jgi:hypothetical protein
MSCFPKLQILKLSILYVFVVDFGSRLPVRLRFRALLAIEVNWGEKVRHNPTNDSNGEDNCYENEQISQKHRYPLALGL